MGGDGHKGAFRLAFSLYCKPQAGRQVHTKQFLKVTVHPVKTETLVGSSFTPAGQMKDERCNNTDRDGTQPIAAPVDIFSSSNRTK